MDTANFKKMALMGMAGGMLIATSQPVISHEVQTFSDVTLASGGCGKGSCGGGHQPQRNQYPQQAQTYRNQPPRYYTADADEPVMPVQTQIQTETTQTVQKTITESELLSQLNQEGKEIYFGLSPEGKALALRYASFQDCQAKGQCNGFDRAFRDKNEAVKAAAQKMAEKRAKMNQGQPTPTPMPTQQYRY